MTHPYDTITVNSGTKTASFTRIVPDRWTGGTNFWTRLFRSGNICVGPDGEIWVAWMERDQTLNDHGVYVARWDPGTSAFVLVTGPTTDGAVSDTDGLFVSVPLGNYTGGMISPTGTGFAPQPEIVCDGTNVFVGWMSNSFATPSTYLREIRVAMWDGASWSISSGYRHATLQIDTLDAAGPMWLYMAASPADVGAVIVAYNEGEGDDDGNLVWERSYCSRWDGSWTNIGGAAFATGFHVPYATPGNPLVLDSDGNPHICSTDTGWATNPYSIFSELRVYSYVSGAWRTTDVDLATLGFGASFQSGGDFQSGWGPNMSPIFDVATGEEHVHVCLNLYRYETTNWCYTVIDFDLVGGVFALPDGIAPPFWDNGALAYGTPIAAYDGGNLHWAIIDGGGSTDADLLRYDINCKGWEVVQISNFSMNPQPLRSSAEHPHVLLIGDAFRFYNVWYNASGEYEHYVWDQPIDRDGGTCPDVGGVFRNQLRAEGVGDGDFSIMLGNSGVKVFSQLPTFKAT